MIEDDLLLSQRAFDFLAELGGPPSRRSPSAPATPMSSGTSRSATPASLLGSQSGSQQPSPLVGRTDGGGFRIDISAGEAGSRDP